MDRMLEGDVRIQADIQLDQYERKLGKFGCAMAESTRKIRSPVFWWEKYGTHTPQLMEFATRVLSLTCSASGCERNWSSFQMIHTKRRNGLEHNRLHALVYVKYNTALRDRNLKRNATMTYPIVVEEIESDDEWITEIEDPVLPTDPRWIENNVEDLTLDNEAVRNVPFGTYQSSILNRDIPLREPTPPREPTPSLDEPILLYKRKFSEGASSSKRKAPRKSMRLDEIFDVNARVNPYDETNPLFQRRSDVDEGNDDNVVVDDDDDASYGEGDSDGDDSLDGDLLIDDDDDDDLEA